ncbi:MAG: glycosyltransferase family 2 protein [Verrucomicrobiota bacterium]|nr:glycosyltransferase family 2 protein [Verrucomicrobiota bacterium]
MRPLISVIVPVFNGERFIADAIDSIVGQDYAPIEILVIDDGSTDRTADIARANPLVIYHRQERQGPGAARNLGVELARGDLLAFLDADDLWLPGKLSRQHEVLEREKCDAVFTHAVQFRDEENADSAPRVGYLPGTMLIRREAFERIGKFATDRATREAFDWQVRAVNAGLRFEVLPQVFYRRRLHGGNRGMVEPNWASYLQVLKTSIDHRRAQDE